MPAPELPGVVSAEALVQTGKAIASVQLPSGEIPWFPGGHTDPWDHVECAMALSVVGQLTEAERAYEWLRRTQRADGSWPLQVRDGVVEDAGADTNYCAYPAVGVWHHVLITGDDSFAERMWPVVRDAVDFVLTAQHPRGEIDWGIGEAGPTGEALLSGSSSVHQSLRCALALAEHVGVPQPSWEVAVGHLGHALRQHPEAFTPKTRYSMDWYYPILGGAVRGEDGRRRIDERWDDFVVEGLGIRCVDDHPWVTGAETCELVLSLDALGEHDRAVQQLAAMQHLRDPDGSYWTGYVFADGKRWPEEQSSWTAAAVILAADAVTRTSRGNGVFRGDDLPTGLPVENASCCEYERTR
ncbi:prenyltransferase [Saccharopolyspora rhizosphaerae]|uniref:Prenyltransferase n=1 Tax=Saccharopolyspora rhizosphaerae TaxID=2492662 RepID=A0A426JWI2_9PSEU|nr:prenyltransferase [Saccharopolyspora rhizosphaerae]RRO17560.1 prenyltransferase [Saccharopolyspora rhizosphaerae]